MNTPSSRKPDPVPPGVNGGRLSANAYRQSGEARNGVPSRKVNPMGANSTGQEMKLSEFVLIHTTGRDRLDAVYFAQVTVTTDTGMLWWKRRRVERRTISRGHFSLSWYFVDTGEFTPAFQAETLERAYRAARELLKAAGR